MKFFSNIKVKVLELFFVLFSIVSFLPVILGLVGTMVGAIIGFYIISYAFWIVLTLIFHGLKIDGNASIHYFVGFIYVGHGIRPLIFIISLLLLLLGIFLFVGGVIQISYAKRHSISIITTYLYKFVRHPQNLGIILISLAIFLYIPTTWDSFSSNHQNLWIRIGDFYSIIFFILLWVLEAGWEEINLLKLDSGLYNAYREKVPFIIPFTKKIEQKFSYIIPKKFRTLSYSKKVLFAISMYLFFIITFTVIFQSSIKLTF